MHLTVRPKLTHSKRNRHIPMAFIYGGGQGQESLYFSKVNPVAAVIASDVLLELQKQKEILQLIQHYRTITMIESETTNSLITKAYPNHGSVLSQIGNCSAQKGMGQRGGLGALGIKPKLDSFEFTETINWLRNRCIQANGGVLPGLTAAFIGSLAGGTNSLSELEIARMVIELGDELDLPAEIDFQVTDSITFTGLGPNVHVNCAVALNALNNFVLRTNQKPGSRTVVNARIATLPPVGDDQHLRQELNLLDKQAWFSTELQDAMLRIGAFAAVSSPFGNISHSSTDYFRSIPRKKVAGQIAADYYEELEQAMDRIQPTPHILTHFDPRLQEKPLVRPSVDDLVDRIDTLDADGFQKGCEAQASEMDYTITAYDSNGRQFDCERLSDHFASSPESLTEAIDDLILIETIRDQLVLEEADNQAELQHNHAQLMKVKPKCLRQFQRTQNARFGAATKLQKLRKLAQQHRDLFDERREREVLAKELDKCLRTVTELKERKLSKLNDVLTVLDHHRAMGKDSRDSGLFYYRTANDAFPSILQLVSCEVELQQLMLASQAVAVTEAGIKFILGANSSDANELSAIAIGDAIIPGAWLAAIEREPHHTFVVFPPMSSALADSLRAAINAKASNWRVIVADSCGCGMNIVRINLFFPRTKSECLPGFLASELQKIEQSDLRVLHMPPEPSSEADQTEAPSSDSNNTQNMKGTPQ